MSRRPPPERPDPDPTDVPGEVITDAELNPQTPSAALAAYAASVAEVAVARTGLSGAGEIWRLSWPVMLSQVLVTMVALVDIAMVGRLGADAVAAVGYATQFFFMTQSALFAVGFACVALMARSIGAGDRGAARAALVASLMVAVATALIAAGAILAAPRAVLGLLNADPLVVEMTIPYLRLVLSASVLLAVSLMLESGLRADRDTVTPMRIAAAVAGAKIALNAVLIFGALGFPRLELVGAGVATVVSQVLGVVLLVSAVARRRAGDAVAITRADLAPSLQLLGKVTRVAAPGVAERVILNLALLSYFAILGGYGTAAVAAYTVGVRALSFSWIPGTGFAAAVATLVGQSLGANDEEEAVRIGRRAAVMAVVVAVVLGVVGGGAREPIARVFSDDPAIIGALMPFMLCLAIAQPMLQLHFTLAGVHRGAGDTWTPLFAATMGNWAFRVPLALLFARVLEADLVWLWIVLIFDHTARAAWLVASFRRGAWRTRMAGPGLPDRALTKVGSSP